MRVRLLSRLFAGLLFAAATAAESSFFERQATVFHDETGVSDFFDAPATFQPSFFTNRFNRGAVARKLGSSSDRYVNVFFTRRAFFSRFSPAFFSRFSPSFFSRFNTYDDDSTSGNRNNNTSSRSTVTVAGAIGVLLLLGALIVACSRARSRTRRSHMATPLLAAKHGPAGILSSAVHIACACACCAGRTRVCIIHPVWLSALCVRTTHLVATLLVASFFHATGSACCPRGHALELFTAATNGCNACSKSIPRGSHMQRCHMCDYDVCQSCQPLVLQGACAQSTRVCTLKGCDTSLTLTTMPHRSTPPSHATGNYSTGVPAPAPPVAVAVPMMNTPIVAQVVVGHTGAPQFDACTGCGYPTNPHGKFCAECGAATPGR